MRYRRQICLALLIVLPSLGLAQPISGSTVEEVSPISVNAIGGLPEFLSNDLRLQWIVPGNPVATLALRKIRYDVVDKNSEAGVNWTLTSSEPIDGKKLTHRYYIAHAGRSSDINGLQMDLELPSGAALEMSADVGFIPEPLSGFGAVYTKVLAILVDANGQHNLDGPEEKQAERNLDQAAWFGIRNRFWTGLLRPVSGPLDIQADTRLENQPRIVARPAGNAARLKLELYAGPVDSRVLAAIDPTLRGMKFAALWDWLRVLCFGMSWLLAGLHALLGNVGLSIVLLSVCVKILMLPLTLIADRWQDAVNKTQALLQPKLDAIKSQYKGEDAHNRVLAVYKEHGVSPMYSVKSLAGFLILIPIFIAAFDVLGESFLLNNTSFLWIGDLTKPDRALPLPWELPFFGGYLNLLPFLMTGVTLYTSWLQTDPSLTPELLRKQRIRLYLMAGVFFLLFYTFPAGMVLYWTTNNVLHLIKIQFGRLRKNAG